MLEVKRNAKVGEWIKTTNDWLAVKKNSIYQVKKEYENGAIGVDVPEYRIGIDGLHVLSPSEYVVLENYQPEVRVLADYKEMNERILNLLTLCMKAKEKGHDAFFSYYPHVMAIDIKVYEGGWTRKADNEPNPPTRSAEFYLDYADANDKADKTIEYLKELIANVG